MPKKHIKYNKNNNLLFFVFVLCYNFIFSQLNVTVNNNASQLAQNILGSGVSISNATLNCGGNAAGFFSYSGNYLGINNGIILTTGYAPYAAYSGTYLCSNSNQNNFSDPQLTAINSNAKYDVCILNFDFIPMCDTVKIKYVFGSEEYPKYLHQMYNDLFGIFLTGPKPGGGSYNANNIATLPNGFTPVSIDSVNEGWPINTNLGHSEYYVDNYTTPNNQIAYNGYTKPITSKVGLIPCLPYHMKIAIADCKNGLYDSGVFIQGNSLGCSNLPVVSSQTLFSCDTKGSAKINITNYTGIPTFTWLPGNEHSDSINNLTPGSYTCYVNLPGICNNFTTIATISDFGLLQVAENSFTICNGESVKLNANGVTNYTWQPTSGLNNFFISNPIATPTITTIYTVTSNSTNNCVSQKTIMVHVSLNALNANFKASANITSIDSSTIKFTDLSNGATNWLWDFGEQNSGSNLKNPVYTYNIPGTYNVHLIVTDNENCIDTISQQIIVNDIIKDLFTFYCPNTFTPNGDGINDSFIPYGVGWDNKSFKMEIYNRWGKKIFTTQDYLTGWDGTQQNEKVKDGVYVYKINLIDNYKKPHEFIGEVNVVK
jgi:gliding motility-associated-like protein